MKIHDIADTENGDDGNLSDNFIDDENMFDESVENYYRFDNVTRNRQMILFIKQFIMKFNIISNKKSECDNEKLRQEINNDKLFDSLFKN